MIACVALLSIQINDSGLNHISEFEKISGGMLGIAIVTIRQHIICMSSGGHKGKHNQPFWRHK